MALGFAGHAGELPPLGKQLDATERPLGKGSCVTSRTGAWEAEGGIVVEIRKPKGSCSFTRLDLVIGNERYPHTTPDASFFVAQTPFGPRYRWWRSDLARIFFKVPVPVNAEDIKGIWETHCAEANCLNEASAAP